MYRRSTVSAVIAILVLESVAVVAISSRIPRPARLLTAAVNAVFIVALVVYRPRE